MGLLDDLSMGLGLKERDDDYYERTARTLGRTQGADREAQYRSSNVFQNKPQRGGLFSFMGGGSDSGSSSGGQSRGFLPTLFGYRDTADMFDRGGPYASGGRFRGAGTYSMLGNIGHALSGGDFDDFQFSPEVDEMIEEMQGPGSAKYLREKEPEMYKKLGQNIVKQNRFGGFAPIQAKAVIKSTNGAVPEATRNAISSLRPNQPVGNGYPDMSMPSIQGYTAPPAPQPPATPAPMAQAATGLTIPSPAPASGVPEMGVATGGNQITPTGDTAYSAILQRLNDPNTSPVEYSYLMAQKQMMETGQYPVGY